MGGKIKQFLCSIPFVVASFLPLEKANSQTIIEKPNTVSLGFQPIDLGISAGYNKKITPRYETYLSLSKGKYRSPLGLNKKEFKESYIDHYKFSFGTNIHFKKDKNDSDGFISIGLSYNIFNKDNYIHQNINEKVLKHWSFEAGAGITLSEKLTIGFLFDPIKGESNLYLGVPF